MFCNGWMMAMRGGVASCMVRVLLCMVVVVFSLLQVVVTCFVPVLELVASTCVCVVLLKSAGVV